MIARLDRDRCRVHSVGIPGVAGGRVPRLAHRARRRRGHRAAAGARLRRRHPLRHRRVAGLGDRHVVRAPRRPTSGRATPTSASACSSKSPPRSGPSAAPSSRPSCRTPRRLPIVFGVVLLISALSSRPAARPNRRARQRPTRSPRGSGSTATYPTPTGREPYHVAACRSASRLMVGGRRAVGAAGHRLRGVQGAGDGPGDAAAVQGLDHDQQLHDRRDRGRQRRRLPAGATSIRRVAMPVMLGVLAGAASERGSLPRSRAGAPRSSSASSLSVWPSR